MFVATANTTDSIPTPLLDRMELIDLTGYTYEEKLQIAKRYLLKKQAEQNGMADCDIEISDDTLMKVIANYTRESGVRNLEREIGSIIRKLAVKRVEDGTTRFTVDKNNLKDYLGAEKFLDTSKNSQSLVGVATGLAWTSVGGVTLRVETVLIPGGKGDVILTGNMGDVMKESAKTALSVVKSRMVKYGDRARKVYQVRFAYTHSRRRHSERRPQRRHHAFYGDYVGHDGTQSGRKRRYDGRSYAYGSCFGDRRLEGKVAGGIQKRNKDAHYSERERQGYRRITGGS